MGTFRKKEIHFFSRQPDRELRQVDPLPVQIDHLRLPADDLQFPAPAQDDLRDLFCAAFGVRSDQGQDGQARDRLDNDKIQRPVVGQRRSIRGAPARRARAA